MTDSQNSHYKSKSKALQPACLRSVIYYTSLRNFVLTAKTKGVKKEFFLLPKCSLLLSPKSIANSLGKFDENVLVTPPLQGTFIFSVAIYQPLKFNKTYIYPTWAYALGWFLGLFCVLVVPLWILFKLVQMKGTVWQVCT